MTSRTELRPPDWVALALQGVALAYLAAGKLGFEPRLALGPVSLNQLLQVVVLCACGIALWRWPRSPAPHRLALLLVALLTLLLAAGFSRTGNAEYAAAKLYGYVLVVLPSLYVLAHWTRGERGVRRALWIWAAAGATMMLLGLVLLVSGQSPARLAVLGGGANVFARMVGSAGLIGIGLVGLRLRGRRALVEVAALLAVAATLVFAGSKAVLVALAAALAVWALCLGRPRRALACLAGGALWVVAPVLVHDLVRDADRHRGEVRMFQKPDLADPNDSYGTRLQFIAESVRLIGSAGLTGVGTGDWGPAVGRAVGRTYPHNWFLELWCELGALGIGLALVVVAWCARLARRARRTVSPRLAATLLALVVFWLVNAQASGDVLDNRNLWWSLLLFEIVVAAHVVPVAAAAPRHEPPALSQAAT